MKMKTRRTRKEEEKREKAKKAAKFKRKKVCPKMQRVSFELGNNFGIKGASPPAAPPLAI